MTRQPILRALTIGVLALGMLSGCAQAPVGMTATAGKQLQLGVAAVTAAAASGDITAAITSLDALERRLREATASGQISADRSAKIDASISLVRADLAAALPPPPSPTPTPTVTVQVPTSGNGGANNSDDNKASNKGSDKGGGKGGK